jgi:hypothetical protein
MRHKDEHKHDAIIKATIKLVKVESNERSHDKDIAQRLWEVSEELTGVKFPIF